MESNCLVSVIVPTYRRDELLYRALDSLAVQTYSPIEVIVVDDNSDKAWNEKVKGVVDRIKSSAPDFKLTYIKNEKSEGSAETRNVGVRASKGEYITFLDDDDIYLPEKIEKQLNDMVSVNADFGITDLELFNESDKMVERRVRDYISSDDPDSLLRAHLMHHLTGTDTLMFKREYLIKIGLFPPINVGDEFYLMERAILGKGKFCYSPHCYVKAYVHEGEDGGLSSGKEKIEGENRIFEEKKRYFSRLDSKTGRYIKMRHFAVIAYAEYRRKGYLRFAIAALKAFFSAPIGCFKLLAHLTLKGDH